MNCRTYHNQLFSWTIKATLNIFSPLFMQFCSITFFPMSPSLSYMQAIPSKPTVQCEISQLWVKLFPQVEKMFKFLPLTPSHSRLPNNLGAWKIYRLLMRKNQMFSSTQAKDSKHFTPCNMLQCPLLAWCSAGNNLEQGGTAASLFPNHFPDVQQVPIIATFISADDWNAKKGKRIKCF